MTQQTQRTFACANLLYGLAIRESACIGLMDSEQDTAQLAYVGSVHAVVSKLRRM